MSFDHMLGYLSLEGGRSDVDGLRAEFANEHGGRNYPVHHLDSTVIEDDPNHSASAVDLQIGGGKMDGFVTSFAETLAHNEVQDADPGRVIGYYNADDVPVYDHLASEFAVCDRWFSSVPGATWPNRLYAIAVAPPALAMPAAQPPAHLRPCLVRATPRRQRRLVALVLVRGGDPALRRWALQAGPPRQVPVLQQDQLELEDQARAQDGRKSGQLSRRRRQGALPSVSWIDPNFSNFNPIGFQPNDDHPPADIKDGQELVLAVYHALATSPQWEKTLLIIFYDEHGGFYDHVAPPAAPDDDPETFGRYGVRIPALIVPRGWSRRPYPRRSSITRRSARRFSCASAQEPSTSKGGIRGCLRGSEAPGAPTPWERASRRPTTSENF